MADTPKYVQFGKDLTFGIPSDELSLITQSVSISFKMEKKEVKDKQGEVTVVTCYNQTGEVSIEGYGDASAKVATRLTLVNTFATPTAGALIIDTCDVTYANEDHVKSSVKATMYPGISATEA